MLSSPVVSCGSVICPILRSIASAAMKQPFGAKPVEFYMRSMFWVAANRKKEDAAPVSMIGENCRSPQIALVEFHLKMGLGLVVLSTQNPG